MKTKFLILSLLFFGAIANAALDLNSFQWSKAACPAEDMIGGRDFNRLLAEEFIRAELEGIRTGGSSCLDPATYRFFKVAPIEMGDKTDTPEIKVKSPDDIQIVSITRFPDPTLENLKLVRYAIQQEPNAIVKKGSKKSRRRAKKPAPIFGDFVFERVKGSTPVKELVGCAAMYRPPTQLMIHSCTK